MALTFLGLAIAIIIFLGMLGMLSLGFRGGRAEAERSPTGKPEGRGSAEGAIYALLGLLLAFSFSGAAARFDHRRQEIVEEANAISTAYLRVDILAPELQPRLRETFKRYVDARLRLYRVLPDFEAARAEMADAERWQGEIWSEAVSLSRPPSAVPAQFLLSPLNEMFEVASRRTAAFYLHPPVAIFVLLVVMAFLSAFLVGHNMASSPRKSRLHMVAYAAALSLVIYAVIDLEFPRVGMIRITDYDRFLVEVREAMK